MCLQHANRPLPMGRHAPALASGLAIVIKPGGETRTALCWSRTGLAGDRSDLEVGVPAIIYRNGIRDSYQKRDGVRETDTFMGSNSREVTAPVDIRGCLCDS